MMRKSLIGLVLCMVMAGRLALAQGGLTFTGTIVDEQTGESVIYATVAILDADTDEVLTGVTTGMDGTFVVKTKATKVYVEVSFMGYASQVIREFSPEGGQVKLGTIVLSQNTQDLQEVVVTGERSTMEFRLDRRVFNVGSDISSTGMGALDVLNNVPSVTVDIEGNISLRGNSGVQILINGKPSVMADEASNALGTITADMIESVEVITNPSAKYEAEGTSGIINIILKKEEEKGFNGSLSANTGYPHNHSLGLSLNRRTNNFNMFTQMGAGYRSMPRYNNGVNHNLRTGSLIESNGVNYRNENFYNLTLGSDYFINDYNTITLSGNVAYELENQPSETEFSLYENTDELVSEYVRREVTSAVNPKWQYDLQYKKEFRNHEDHVLLVSTQGSFFGKDQSSEFTNTLLMGASVAPNQRTATNYFQRDFNLKADYTNPLTEEVMLEAGGLYEINDVGNDYAVYDDVDGDWVVDPALTNNFLYNQKVLGLYSTGSYEGEKWGVKVGLRVENTNLRTYLENTGQENFQNYTNLFPTLHTSYNVNEGFSLQAGYSKRIFRPRLWDLNPFFNISNNYSIRRGNPNLQPEFADSYEITGIFIFEKSSLNASVYHLYTTDVVDRVTYFEDNVNITTPLNVGTRRKTGVELNGDYQPTKWLTITGDFNYGYFIREGVFENQDFNFEGDQWSLNGTAKFKLPAKIDLEVSSRYESGYATVQGQVSGFMFADAGLRKKLWDGRGVLNLGVRDIFASRIRESIVDQPDYYVYNFGQRGRFLTLGFSYSLGKGEAMTYSGRHH